MQIDSRFRLMAGVLAVYCWSCSHDSPTQPPIKRWPVSGTVEDRLGGMPIEGAALKFFSDKDSVNTISDSRGWFEVQLLAGDYFFAANKGGYLEYRDTVKVVEPGIEVRVQLVLELAKRWPVSGTVEDRSGLPIAGADLKFYNAKDSANAISDSSGRFEVKLWTGRYLFTANKAGHLEYSDTLEVAAPGLELRVQLVLNPTQDYLPLAVGNWWVYDDTNRSLSSGLVHQSWGTERWEIVSSSKGGNKITHVVRLETSGITIISSGGGGPPYDTTNYAYARNFEMVEREGRVIVDLPRGTVLKHFMQPGETFSTPVNVCGISSVSLGIPMLVDNRQVETIAVNYLQAGCAPAVLPGSEKLLLARQIGIVSWELNLGPGNTRLFKRLTLRRYFIQSKNLAN